MCEKWKKTLVKCDLNSFSKCVPDRGMAEKWVTSNRNIKSKLPSYFWWFSAQHYRSHSCRSILPLVQKNPCQCSYPPGIYNNTHKSEQLPHNLPMIYNLSNCNSVILFVSWFLAFWAILLIQILNWLLIMVQLMVAAENCVDNLVLEKEWN